MKDMGVAAALARDALFADTDAALEWVEDQLIIGSRSGAALSDEVPLDRLTVLAGPTAAERELVGRTLGRRVYQRGDIVIKEGDTDRSLFMISKPSRSTMSSSAPRGLGLGGRLAGTCQYRHFDIMVEAGAISSSTRA